MLVLITSITALSILGFLQCVSVLVKNRHEILAVVILQHRLCQFFQPVRCYPAFPIGDAFKAGHLQSLAFSSTSINVDASDSESCVPVSSHAKPLAIVCTFSSLSFRNSWFTVVISNSPRAEGLMLLATLTTLLG